jgi:hypoxanthine phosphoribosyltransferase
MYLFRIKQIIEYYKRTNWGWTIVHHPNYEDYVEYKAKSFEDEFLFFKRKYTKEVETIRIKKEDIKWEKCIAKFENIFFGRHTRDFDVEYYLYVDYENKFILIR